MRDNDVNVEQAKNDINDIIDDSYLHAYFKEEMKEVFASLKKHEAEVISGIYDDIRQEDNAQNREWQLCTVLVPNNDFETWQSRGFFHMCATNNAEQIAFLNCSIYDAEDLVNNNDCLQFCEQFVLKEKDLFILAEKNDINVPVIFSPWARRAVLVKEENVSLEVEKYLLRDYTLLWNVSAKKAYISGYVRPEGDDCKYTYTIDNDEENGFLLCQGDDVEIKNLENGKRKIISPRELDGSIATWILPKKVDIDATYMQELGEKFWLNNINPGKQIVRLMTKGDIEYVLGRFTYNQAGQNLKASFYGFQADAKNIIKRYSIKEMHYAYCNEENSLYTLRRDLKICYVAFSGNDKWLADYMEYVLSYLESFYPEFRWAGVRV